MGLKALPIIQYQNISRRSNINDLWLSIEPFQRQLQYLTASGFQILSMDQAIDCMEGRSPMKNLRPISLTFDNGFMDFFLFAYPLLKHYQVPGTLLISPDKVGKTVFMDDHPVTYLTWGQLRELAKNDINIGAYEDHARNINDISHKISARHVIDYQKILEDRLDMAIRYFGVKEGVPTHQLRDLLIARAFR